MTVDLPRLRVLVVDDDADNRRIICRYLPSPPLEVETAVDGRAALDAAEANVPDVILLDLEMPVMDGVEAAVRIRARERATGRKRSAIISFSAHSDEAVRRRSLQAGCDFYLTKPVSRAVLLRTLLDAVRSAPPAAAEPAPTPGTPEARPDDPVIVDPDLANSLPDFLGSRGAALDELDTVLTAEERGRLRRLAHRLAGSFGLYGFRWAARQCRCVEHDAEQAERTQLAEMLAALRLHLETVDVQCEGRSAVKKGGPVDGGTGSITRGG